MKLKNFIFLLLLAFTIVNASSQLLYKIEGNGLQNPSYIFGTHHLAPISIIEKTGAADYFKETQQVVGEIDMTVDPMTLAMQMQKHMMAPADSVLSKLISDEDFEIINEEFKKYSPMQGLDLNSLQMLKPAALLAMVEVGIMQELIPDYDQENQLDTYFQKIGKEQGKTIIPLEDAEFQAKTLFDFTPISVQAEMLVELLKNPEKSREMAIALNEAYEKGDLESMLFLDDEKDEADEEFEKILVNNRNADWLTKLPAIINNGSTFIAVGALHLVGDNGIIQGLRNMGYTVNPIQK